MRVRCALVLGGVMSAKILDGEALAKSIREGIARQVDARLREGLRAPGLAVLLVGDDPASELYVRLKRRDCEQSGFRTDVRHLSTNTTQDDLITILHELNHAEHIDGILVQLPLPGHIDANRVIEEIDPVKDVDGIHPYNIGMLALRQPALRSCTSKGIMTLLNHCAEPIRGMNATVVGASNHVGRPIGLELLLAGCTVTTAHRFSRDTQSHVASADIVVSATGHAGLIRADWVKPGAIVIDVGITRHSDGSLKGDVDFDAVREVAGWITPVPGGVGPMTRVSILQNVLESLDRLEA